MPRSPHPPDRRYRSLPFRAGFSSAGLALSVILLPAIATGQAVTNRYPWPSATNATDTLADRIAPPAGFERTPVEPGSFADWLRHLPLKEPGAPVLYYNGAIRPDQTLHAAVVEIDIGERNLQQCADAVIRLRAEYLFAVGRLDDIRFNATSGDPLPFSEWVGGMRPVVIGNRVKWEKAPANNASHASFREYLDAVFTWAGTLSLARELAPRKVPDMRIGDVFIRGGSPGHAMIVVDMAWEKASGRKVFLLAQSYMPAQDIHIVTNPGNPKISPWYDLNIGKLLVTPNWKFELGELKAFREPRQPPPSDFD